MHYVLGMTTTEHTHKVRYLSPNTVGLAKARGENESYLNLINARTVLINAEECRSNGCPR